MEQKITLKQLNLLCKSLMNWNGKEVEARFHGTRKELLEILNGHDELEIDLFFSGFFCENPIIEALADGQTDVKKLSTSEKIGVFIGRGLVLCYLTNHEPGLVVRPCWQDKLKASAGEAKDEN